MGESRRVTVLYHNSVEDTYNDFTSQKTMLVLNHDDVIASTHHIVQYTYILRIA